MNKHKGFENMITRQLQSKADELGIEFKVKFSVKEGMNDFLIRIKKTIPNDFEGLTESEIEGYKEIAKNYNKFTDYVSKLIVPQFAYGVRFTYPSKL